MQRFVGLSRKSSTIITPLQRSFKVPRSSRLLSTSPVSRAGGPSTSPPTSTQTNTKKKHSLVYRAGRAAAVLAVGGGAAWYFITETLYETEHDPLHRHRPPPIYGGPKNLVSTHGCKGSVLKAEEFHKDDPRQRLVVLGSGWGAVSVLRELDHKKFHVTVISPNNYFLFTPLLPSATVGTLELRSLIEPIRRLLSRWGGYYLEGKAVDVDFEGQLVEVEGIHDSEGRRFYVPYDRLVIAVGSESMTHGVEGLEHVNFLKSIQDARDIRKKLIENFEFASLPTSTDEERRQRLSIVICGGGPTGIEFAAEVYDFLKEDLVGYFPMIDPEEVKVTIIQSPGHILNTYDLKISEMTEAKFKRENIDVRTDSRVVKVNEKSVVYRDKKTGKEYEVPFGVCLWSTGVGMTSFVKHLVNKLPSGSQTNKHAIEMDPFLRVLGTPEGTVYAVGDCSTLPQPHFVDRILEIFKAHDTNNDNAISYEEFQDLAGRIVQRHPMLSMFLYQLDKVFARYDKDKSGSLDLEEIHAFLTDAEKNMTALPATAQVASQQGKYVGRRINTLNDISEADPKNKDVVAKLPAFAYRHLGSLAYIGGSEAVLDAGNGMVYSGFGSEYMWRSIYFSEQVSMRTRILLAVDWSKKWLFGRDTSKF